MYRELLTRLASLARVCVFAWRSLEGLALVLIEVQRRDNAKESSRVLIMESLSNWSALFCKQRQFYRESRNASYWKKNKISFDNNILEKKN